MKFQFRLASPDGKEPTALCQSIQDKMDKGELFPIKDTGVENGEKIVGHISRVWVKDGRVECEGVLDEGYKVDAGVPPYSMGSKPS